MELNGRTWGSMALARRRGLDYPAWAVQAALDPEFEPPYPGLAEIPAPNRPAWGRGSCAWAGWLTAQRDSRSAGAVRDVLAWHRGERWYNWRPGEAAVFTTADA